MSLAVAFVFALLSLARGQQIGTETAETHPSLSVEFCTTAGGCTTQQKSVVLDGNWRWLHETGTTTNCYTGNTWDATLCPDPTTCAANCALDGADYEATYGITTSGNALTIGFVTSDNGMKNVGSRLYLLDTTSAYHEFNLLNQEFTFTVDMSKLPCGLNGAVYFSQMDADGGMARFPTNKAGAAYGTGYCDSQCPKDIKFINGLANIVNWTGDANNANAGTGAYGTCCTEMDIWEANSNSAAVTPHPCTVTGQTECSGLQCGASGTSRYSGVCDPDGCDFNSWRNGDQTFLGPGLTIDTTKPITVITQFITADNTATGALTEIRRFYQQGTNVYANSFTNIPSLTTQFNSITDATCDAQKTAFGDTNYFETVGGLTQLGTEFAKGMVLVLSLWDDYAVDMLWLDSDYPTNASATAPGVSRGPCATTSGVPATVESASPNAQVIYSNIKFGDINSTFPATSAIPAPPPGGAAPPSSSAPASSAPASSSTKPTTPTSSSKSTAPTSSHTTSSAAPSSTATAPHYGQCGGIGWTGPTACVAGTTCQVSNPYYSQCL